MANNNLANKFMVVAERRRLQHAACGATPSTPSTATPARSSRSSTAAATKINPVIGGDSFLVGPTYFLVAWEWAFTPTDHNIAARLLDPSGAMVGSDIFLELTNVNQSNPAISKSNLGGDWMVVWQSSFSATDEDIHAAKVGWDGTINYPAMADLSSISQTHPKVSSPLPSGEYLTVYESLGTITTRLTSSNLTTLQSTTLEALGDNPFAQIRSEPAVDCDGDKFVVGYSEVWLGNPNDRDMYVDTLCADGGRTPHG